MESTTRAAQSCKSSRNSSHGTMPLGRRHATQHSRLLNQIVCQILHHHIAVACGRWAGVAAMGQGKALRNWPSQARHPAARACSACAAALHKAHRAARPRCRCPPPPQWRSSSASRRLQCWGRACREWRGRAWHAATFPRPARTQRGRRPRQPQAARTGPLLAAQHRAWLARHHHVLLAADADAVLPGSWWHRGGREGGRGGAHQQGSRMIQTRARAGRPLPSPPAAVPCTATQRPSHTSTHHGELRGIIKAGHERGNLLGRDRREAGVLRPDAAVLAPDRGVCQLAARRQLAHQMVIHVRLPRHDECRWCGWWCGGESQVLLLLLLLRGCVGWLPNK